MIRKARGTIATPLALVCLLGASTPAPARDPLPSGFVFLRDIAPDIAQDIRYAGPRNFTGAPLPGYHSAECVLRRPVALALKHVQDDLAGRKLLLKVYDCYRPTRAVAAMARWAAEPRPQVDTRHFYPQLEKARLFALGYLSNHSAHSRGIAVDLTLVQLPVPVRPEIVAARRSGSCAGPIEARAPDNGLDNSLDMGTGFDCFDPRSATRHPAMTRQQQANRQLLLDAMRRRGFQNYRREWWHFAYPAADIRVEFDFPVERR